jgi:hypothetical protein
VIESSKFSTSSTIFCVKNELDPVEFKVVFEFQHGKVTKLEDEFTKDFPARIEESWEYLLEHGSECFDYRIITLEQFVEENFEKLV